MLINITHCEIIFALPSYIFFFCNTLILIRGKLIISFISEPRFRVKPPLPLFIAAIPSRGRECGHRGRRRGVFSALTYISPR